MLRSISFIVVLGFTACGGDGAGGPTPRQACEDLSSALCERIYACLTPAELAAAGLPASEAACVTAEEAANGCAAETLDNVCTGGNEKYDASEAAKCSDQVVGLTCSQVRDPALDVKTAAPACAKTCVIP
jgi:hypothetical protein